MPKTVNVKLIKGFEIKPNTKYLLVLPIEIGKDPQVGAALTRLFQSADSEVLGLVLKDPDSVQVIEVPQKEADATPG